MGAVGKQKRTASATDDMLRYFVREAKEGFVSVVMSCCAFLLMDFFAYVLARRTDGQCSDTDDDDN
ncbi:hypothetical protein I305_00463 [Cryptococcus gattii E566]|uniref:Uncharacterized protein n=2 Tax=Cryptococcus gattii TaxID=37769 RepID=E6QYP1_CRYGW|nr:Hypothetical Protein CGB_A9060C [Cryptococcus gattii WM276]ADV20018.1 Hypothetical Protein CGB_A9060C [Cryptococcus gattii WM276]KIR79419.1 hypothetical protein I306_03538 [Cryptococcus gattii EJB2]KIY37365.1 hypothetical protein I305_00463 [Cryptococcus gattii E566]KJE02651.1 hypothetical protein I311_03626 [Cryptococcus gattii NT-10]